MCVWEIVENGLALQHFGEQCQEQLEPRHNVLHVENFYKHSPPHSPRSSATPPSSPFDLLPPLKSG